MTTIRMHWEYDSYYLKIKQLLRLAPSPAQSLIEELQQGASLETLKKVVAYLADYRDTNLEQALQGKLSIKDIENLTIFSLETGRLKMLDVCQKMVSLANFKIGNISELAKGDALVTPKPQRTFEVISKSVSEQWSRHLGIFGKIVRYFIATATWSYEIDLDKPPKNRWDAQNQMRVFRTMGKDFRWIGTTFLPFFSSTWKAAIAGAGIVASLMGLKYLYHRYNMGTPENLDKKYFRYLNTEANKGLLKKTVGRKKELKMIETCLSPPSGGKPCIPILVGSPGVGKTQLVEGLALNIVNGKTARLTGKKVIVVNTSNLSEYGNFSESGHYSSRLDSLFEKISGYEDQLILFFDEAHNGAVGKDSPGLLLEQLKTKLLERNVLCVLATTTEEYEEYIAPNKAFVDRTERIDVLSLSKEETKDILQEKVGFSDDVEVTLDAIDAVVKVADEYPKYKNRANPRKSTKILERAINHVYAWAPHKIDAEIEKKELEYRKYRTECLQTRRQTPGWSSTEDGKTALQKLKGFETDLEKLHARKTVEKDRFETISRLKKMELVYSRREYEVIHLLADANQKLSPQALEEAQKTYLFLQFVLLPQLRNQIGKAASQLEEKMPLRVDAEVIRGLYKIDQA